MDTSKWPAWLIIAEVVKICGVYVGKDSQKPSEEKILDNVEKNIAIILPQIRMKFTRARTINAIVLSQIWHLATVTRISDKTMEKINRLIYKVIWENRENEKNHPSQ